MEHLRVDAASPDEARALLASCCASTSWIDRMLDRRPFGSMDAMLTAAGDEWRALSPADWLEAFAAHPRIGDREALRRRFGDARDLPAQEQAGVAGASDDILSALAEGNAAYERRFGFIFIVCASGLRADQMLSMLQARLSNDRQRELVVAAGEQAKITALRLANL
jgi:2-oxo-4-hydroxy-4-carboxy-5-ureidoimidazoline decarboxylase